MMNIVVPLQTTLEQHAQLCRLRSVFSQVCNELTPEVQRTGVWDRVSLHHLYYRSLREKYPQLGSQMVCNAIYAVSKVCRMIYQNIGQLRRAGIPLPLFSFAQTCPVYFDRHTLSVLSSGLSLFTMDGRVRFALQMPNSELEWFKRAKLLEIVLQERSDHVFELSFQLGEPVETAAGQNSQAATRSNKLQEISFADNAKNGPHSYLPDYVYLKAAA
jgi:hypothetical protein